MNVFLLIFSAVAFPLSIILAKDCAKVIDSGIEDIDFFDSALVVFGETIGILGAITSPVVFVVFLILIVLNAI